MRLSKRLQAVADFVEENCILADIGTDHAYLPIDLMKKQKIQRAIACDIHQGPFEAARRAIKAAGLEEQIAVRLGDGITVLKPGEADFVTIAGMGGMTVLDILEKRLEVTALFSGMVLQPQNAGRQLRRWLLANGWMIQDEDLVLEDDRLYEIIFARRGQATGVEDILYDIGPCLWKKRHPLIRMQIENLMNKTRRVLRGMEQSASASQAVKYGEAKESLKALEAKLTCL